LQKKYDKNILYFLLDMIFKQGTNPNFIVFNDLVKVFSLNKKTTASLGPFYLFDQIGSHFIIVELCDRRRWLLQSI